MENAQCLIQHTFEYMILFRRFIKINKLIQKNIILRIMNKNWR